MLKQSKVIFYYEVFLRNKRLPLDKKRDPETCNSVVGLLLVSMLSHSTLSLCD